MERQMSFAEVEFAGKKRTTRREQFLSEMDKVVPWQRLIGRIAPHYPKGERGRRPIGIERMLLTYPPLQSIALNPWPTMPSKNENLI